MADFNDAFFNTLTETLQRNTAHRFSVGPTGYAAWPHTVTLPPPPVATPKQQVGTFKAYVRKPDFHGKTLADGRVVVRSKGQFVGYFRDLKTAEVAMEAIHKAGIKHV